MIAIINYGLGNLSSVAKAIVTLGYQLQVTTDPEEVLRAEIVVLPGVGAAGDTMRCLQQMGMTGAIRQVIAERRPFLGICLGLQVLLTTTEESGGQECFDIIPGVVRRLPSQIKVPHMGWNQVRQKRGHFLFEGIADDACFYFVHSYYVEPVDRSVVVGETKYGINFCSVLARDNLVATQFHPEKSGDIGLQLLKNFLEFGSQSP